MLFLPTKKKCEDKKEYGCKYEKHSSERIFLKECCCVKIILVYYIDQKLFKQSCYANNTEKY